MPVGALCSASSPVWISPPFPDSRDLAAVNARARSTLIWASWTFLIRVWLGEMTDRLIQAIMRIRSFRRNFVLGFTRIVSFYFNYNYYFSLFQSFKGNIPCVFFQNASQTFKRVQASSRFRRTQTQTQTQTPHPTVQSTLRL